MTQPEPKGLLEGLYEVDIVGESFYPESFQALPKGDCFAELRADPTNPYDAHAVGVFVEGHQVGHLPREMAETLCSHVTRRTESHGKCIVRAEIAGARGRQCSVKLTLPPPEAF